MLIRKVFFFTILLFLLAFTPLLMAKSVPGILEYAGADRTYELFVPENYDAEEPSALIVALHGIFSTGKALQALSHLDAAAETMGALVVYPDGLFNYWDDGRYDAGLFPRDGKVDDVGFILALIDQLATDYAIDPEKIYLTGTSNGGTMAYTLACAAPERFAAVAIVSSGMWNYQIDNCRDEAAAGLRMLVVHGSEDATYNIEGRVLGESETGQPLEILSLDATLQFWMARYGCDRDTILRSDVGQVITVPDCEQNSQVSVVIVRGASSTWMRTGAAYQLNDFGVNATDLITAFFRDGANWQQPAAPAVNFAGEGRTWITYVPASYSPDTPTPLVLVLHGRPSNSTGMAYITEVHKVAEKYGFITIYPDGINREWNYPKDLLQYTRNKRDDVAFLVTLVEDLSVDLNIDRARVYVTGFSNGGFMTQRVACEAPNAFAAYGVVGATVFHGMAAICDAAPPVPIIFIHGTEDVSIPWAGDERGLESVENSVSFWGQHNQCDANATSTIDIPPQDEDALTRVRHFSLNVCAPNTTVELYAILGGGHNWSGVPGADRIGPEIAGETNMDINAGEIIWQFFSRYALPQEGGS